MAININPIPSYVLDETGNLKKTSEETGDYLTNKDVTFHCREQFHIPPPYIISEVNGVFPHLNKSVLERVANRWANRDFHDAQIERICLYRYSPLYRFPKDEYLLSCLKYCIVFEIDHNDKSLSSQTYDLKVAIRDGNATSNNSDELKALVDAGNVKGNDRYSGIFPSDFWECYQQPPRENWQEDWLLCLKFKDSSFLVSVLSNEPYWILFDIGDKYSLNDNDVEGGVNGQISKIQFLNKKDLTEVPTSGSIYEEFDEFLSKICPEIGNLWECIKTDIEEGDYGFSSWNNATESQRRERTFENYRTGDYQYLFVSTGRNLTHPTQSI